ncbi:MAG: nuclear transport factor 2 family protein [Actinomycetota bacterium]
MSLAEPLPQSIAPAADRSSRLDHPSQRRFEMQPFYTLTTALLRAVREHDFDTLATLCDDDAGIVDVDPSGQSVMVRTREEWEAWFHQLFGALGAIGAETDSLVLDYHSTVDHDLGWSMLEFRQYLEIGDLVATFDCVSTIIWKRTPDGWREARWHCSVLSQDVPDELAALADPEGAAPVH